MANHNRPQNRNGAVLVSENRDENHQSTPEIYRQTQCDYGNLARTCNQLADAGYDTISTIAIPHDTMITILAKRRGE